jgi:hypothetical protein
MRIRGRPGQLCAAVVLALAIVGSVAACGGQGPGTPPPPSAFAKPTGRGTPVPGAPIRDVTHADGHYEAIIVNNGIAYVSTDAGGVYALRTSDGTVLWHQTTGGGSTIYAVADGAVYALSGEDGSMVYALRADTGALLWRHAVGQPVMGMAVSQGVVYLNDDASGTTGSSVYALRASDGAPLWRQHINNSVMGITEENGRVDVMTQLNVAYALRASDGSLLWKQSIDHFATWGQGAQPYTADNGVIYVGTDRGVVQAIRGRDGVVLWRYSIPPTPVPTQPIYGAAVTFASSVPYVTALRLVTDLGLRPSRPCINVHGAWEPAESDAQWYSNLLVASTSLAPVGWLARLQSTAGVARVQPNPEYHCPLMGFATPVPGGTYYLPPEQAGTLVRITFAASADYDTTLTSVYDLGFVLANPCYDELPQGTAVHWTSMGQEASFGSTHALLVVTSPLNSTQWQQQAQALVGMSNVQVRPAVTCGQGVTRLDIGRGGRIQ